jgi:hypothetical protein
VKPRLIFFALSLLAALTPAAAADETLATQREYLRGLRARGLARVALDYLDKHGDDPALAPVLPVEMARTRLSLILEKSPEQRGPLLEEFYAQLLAQINETKDAARSAELKWELAHVAAARGRAGVALLPASATAADRDAAAAKAREHFALAETAFEDALTALAETTKDADPPRPLAVAHAKFDRALALYDQAMTYPEDDPRKRPELVAAARKLLQESERAAVDGKDDALYYLSAAWLMRCYQEFQDSTKAAASLQRIQPKDARAAEAMRLARAFRLEGLRQAAGTKPAAYNQIQREALDWLKAYGRFRHQPEGLAVRVELVRAYVLQARATSKDPKNPIAAKLLAQAEAELAGLEKEGGEAAIAARWLTAALAGKVAGDDPFQVVSLGPEDRSPLGCRKGRLREILLRDGGTKESEEAVARGLKWLLNQQLPDGHWALDGDFPDRGQNDDVAGTAFGLLPLLAAGYTHQQAKNADAAPYHQAVARGLAFLLSKQDRKTGRFSATMYSNALATIAVLELYAMTKDNALTARAQLAVNYLVNAQHDGGGWRYQPKQPGDLSVTGWQVTALKVAKLGGLTVPDAVFARAQKFVNQVNDKNTEGYGYTGPTPTPTMTAVGLLCRNYLQGWGPQNAALVKGVETYVQKNPPPAAGAPKNMYYFYYATQLMHRAGGDSWKDWNDKMRDSLVRSQDKSATKLGGSWDSRGDPHSGAGGRLMCTSLSLLTLQVYYRYPPPRP